jgi:serine/threonine protein kinase
MLPGDPFDLTGEMLDGQYRVQSVVRPVDVDPIVIYRGDHQGVPIAIECLRLPADIEADRLQKTVEAFLEGGRLHHQLARGHPAIAQSIAVGSRLAPRTGIIVPYLVREWLEGESLAEEMARPLAVRRIGRDLGETLALFEPAIEALGYAHAQSAAHLAIGPRTLFLEARGDAKQLKILDFGIARAIDTTLKSRRSHSLEYTAPELQDRGGPEPGAPADVYAIARILRDVLTGMELPRNLELALSRAADRVPDRRPKDASRLWEEMSASIRTPAVSGAVPSKRAVSEPAPPTNPPPVHVISKPPPAHIEAALPAVIVEGRPGAARSSAERTVMIEAVVEARSRKRNRTLSLFAVMLLLAAGGAAFFFGAWRRHHAQPVAANVAPPASVVPVPSASASASADSSDAAAASVEASAPLTPIAHFSKTDAKAALDATAKDVARCKKGKGWGTAVATVAFGNDGSVSHVAVGPPFGGTGTGACVSDALQTAKMPPYGGKPGFIQYHFFVASH